MFTLFDYAFEVTPEIELLALNLYKRFCRYSFVSGKQPVNYEIVFDSYTTGELKNNYDWGLLVTRYDNSRVFLYYRDYFIVNSYCLNYFDV